MLGILVANWEAIHDAGQRLDHIVILSQGRIVPECLIHELPTLSWIRHTL